MRFHLHPAIKATRLTDGHGVTVDDAHQGSVDLQRRRRSGAARRQRLSCRQRRPAPHRADWSSTDTRARRLAWPGVSSRRPPRRSQPPAPCGGRGKRSRGCRCSGTICDTRRFIFPLRLRYAVEDERPRATMTEHSSPRSTGPPRRLRQIRDRRIRPRAFGLRDRTGLDRRHAHDAERGRPCRARSVANSPAFRK